MVAFAPFRLTRLLISHSVTMCGEMADARPEQGSASQFGHLAGKKTKKQRNEPTLPFGRSSGEKRTRYNSAHTFLR